MKNALVLAVGAFAVVKIFLEFLAWLGAEDKDAIYRKHLDGFFDSLDKNSLFTLALQMVRRVATRLRVAEVDFLTLPWLVLISVALLFNYVSLLFSFANMARHNVNFTFAEMPLARVAWHLFRELGFFGSQQIVWMSICNTSWTLFAFSVSRRLLLRARQAADGRQLWAFMTKQVGVIVLALIAMFGSLYISVLLYDFGGNTETQQYLFTQSVRMIYAGESGLVAILLTNTLVSCLPGVLLFILLSCLALARSAPDRLRTIMSHLVFRECGHFADAENAGFSTKIVDSVCK